MLFQAVANLLDNAMLASDARSTVSLVVGADAGWLQITVMDRGRGMSDQELARAFELGFTTRGGCGGSGVGLAMCRETVEGLGGTIALERVVGGGIRARVTLPMVGGVGGPSPEGRD